MRQIIVSLLLVLSGTTFSEEIDNCKFLLKNIEALHSTAWCSQFNKELKNPDLTSFLQTEKLFMFELYKQNNCSIESLNISIQVHDEMASESKNCLELSDKYTLN